MLDYRVVVMVPEDLFGVFDPMSVLALLLLYGPAYLSNTGAMIFGKAIPKITGMKVWVIDSGKDWKDGNRLLGDGKSWNGLLGGPLLSGFLTMLATHLWSGNGLESKPFYDPLMAMQHVDPWFTVFGLYGSAFFIGYVLGFGSLVGDSLGSFVKRRRGLKREGEISSKAPLLDTLPFAVVCFIFGLVLFPNQLYGSHQLIPSMIWLLILTPIIHRSVNVFGYKIGLKSVPY